MRVGRLCFWRVCGCVLLVLLLGLSSPGGADDAHTLDVSLAGHASLRLPEERWVGFLVNVEEYYPIVDFADYSSEIRSLVVMPGVFVQVPDRHFRPYIGAGFGMSINGLPFDTPLAPLPLSIEETLVMHVGGGCAYHLGDKLALTGGARIAQFKTTDFLGHFAPSSSPLIQNSLDFSSYTVEFGIRLVY
jgi:hypothetical protein